jgi:hypothetical protein
VTNSLAAVQAENGLWRALWAVAVDEAYNAKDAVRRTGEIVCSEREVVEVYFEYHPEMKRWAERHIQDGTREAAIHELRAELAKVRAIRAERRRPRNPTPAPAEDPDDWMAPFKSGPAIWPTSLQPPTIEGVVEPGAPGAGVDKIHRKIGGKAVEREFNNWLETLPKLPTKKQADAWAIANKFSTAVVRPSRSWRVRRGRHYDLHCVRVEVTLRDR